ncbi:hypothetical protein QVD17_30637 [Tagetes erecta]|uniref:Cytochrome P450 n=1 Tax=Tagetes erecta TaxID=13708 RepID=A0AAD8K4N3_TARER|nr:hypothetical protein QVD17_30637 [Tagetes erecta]
MHISGTFQLINETVRLANIVPGVFRKALKDIKFKDYTIPTGWAVMVCPPAVHLNPVNYKDPLEFNPSRWERMEQKGASKNFMAFGGGMRFCVGTDFTKLQMMENKNPGRPENDDLDDDDDEYDDSTTAEIKTVYEMLANKPGLKYSKT